MGATRNQDKNALICVACGAPLTFSASLGKLACEYCGSEVERVRSFALADKLSLDPFLSGSTHAAVERHEVVELTCQTCGASEGFPEQVISATCPFCASPIRANQATSRELMRPQGILPFAVAEKEASKYFHDWLRSRWFAPSDLARMARQANALKGVYLPYWSFDSDSESDYEGQRGINRVEWRTVTRKVNGRNETVRVAHTVTDWFPVRGRIRLDFRDFLEPATLGLPRERLIELEPWDLERLESFSNQVLAGFWSESYRIEPREGFEAAKQRMQSQIEGAVRREIGGDQQRIQRLEIRHNHKKFRYLLLPVWLSSYRYGGKLFQFMVNARTGEVTGFRPYSWIKITLAVLGGVGLLAAFYYQYLHGSF